jgi:hypothetical protein
MNCKCHYFFWEIKGRSSGAQLRGKSFMYRRHPWCQHYGPKTGKERHVPPLSGFTHKGHSPATLHYILFCQGGHLLGRFMGVVEDPPISLLPRVPYNVNEDSIEPRSCFGTLLAASSHQLAKQVRSSCGSCTLKFSQDRAWFQTALAKGHRKER